MFHSAGRALRGLTSRLSGAAAGMEGGSAGLRWRPLSLSGRASARSKPSSEDEAVGGEPIKFSTSKASHRTWRVDRSMGSQYERPWWKVLPISLAFAAFLLWCVLRQESDVDAQLEKQLHEHLPGLVSDEQPDEK